MGSLLLSISLSGGATITVQTNVLGPTPTLLAYNSGHFYPGSNTREWWRYAGVNGARVFMAPSNIEASDDLAPVGDGVSTQAGFLGRKAALRANPLSPAYINWSYFSNRYETVDLGGNNHLKVNFALGEMRKLGIQVCAQITASESRLPISGPTDWPNMWELWQHYYAQAFYLGRVFDVQRYQMFNEPNHPNANGLTQQSFLLRLQLAGDAIQSALADVNALYGKSLVPTMLAPVTSGSADGSYAGWGDVVVTNRHLDFLGQTEPNFWLVQKYDYHQYNGSPSTFGTDLANLNAILTSGMAPEPRFPTTISEFNTHTGATFDTLTATLDSPTEYPLFAAILVRLMANACDELYAFKFSHTKTDASYTYPVQKNAMHYVDNDNSPWNIGGVNKAGEVYRLFNKAFAPGRVRLGTVKGTGATSLEVHASYDPVARRYYLFSANNTAGDVALSLNLSAWDMATNAPVLVEEVSESCYGSVAMWTNAGPSRTVSATQRAYTVWLLSVAAADCQPELILTAAEDAELRDGSNSTLNFGDGPSLTARNDPASTANRSVALLKFQLPVTNLANLEFALLSLQAAGTTNAPLQAWLYGVDSNDWSQSTVTWNSGPNLKDNMPAGVKITNSFVEGIGTSAHVLGQVVVTSTNYSEELVDVTSYLRSQTNRELTFLVAQVPRWDVTLPSLAVGDTQPGGVVLASTEGATTAKPAPRLRLVFGPPEITPLRPRITNISVLPNGQVLVSFLGSPGQTYVVEACPTPLAAWTGVSTNVASADGAWTFSEPPPLSPTSRFFRARTR